MPRHLSFGHLILLMWRACETNLNVKFSTIIIIKLVSWVPSYFHPIRNGHFSSLKEERVPANTNDLIISNWIVRDQIFVKKFHCASDMNTGGVFCYKSKIITYLIFTWFWSNGWKQQQTILLLLHFTSIIIKVFDDLKSWAFYFHALWVLMTVLWPWNMSL